jgi:hypothetical protein
MPTCGPNRNNCVTERSNKLGFFKTATCLTKSVESHKITTYLSAYGTETIANLNVTYFMPIGLLAIGLLILNYLS